MKLTGPKKYLHRYQMGERLTPGQTFRAKCCECMGDFVDGRMDCEIPECPIYPFMPYGKAVFASRLLRKQARKELNPEARARMRGNFQKQPKIA